MRLVRSLLYGVLIKFVYFEFFGFSELKVIVYDCFYGNGLDG